MNINAQPIDTDHSVTLLTIIGLWAVSLFVQHALDTRHALLFLIGAGLGVCLYHAAFGFTGGWRRLIRERQSAGVRAQILLLALSSLLFIPLLAGAVGSVRVSGAISPVGTSVLVGAFLFGVGMQLGGGCGSGTLFTVGGGSVRMLVTLTFFVIGAVIGTAHLHWWLGLPDFGRISLIDSVGWGPALAVQLVVLAVLYVAARAAERRRYGQVAGLGSEVWRVNVAQRLVHGPWPLWWGALGLAALGLCTLLVAGHPWSITFAFGLWGAKIWQALGGDVASWPYWSTGYPAQALSRSVLADVTSLMDFGIILGAVLAAALAGKFAPDDRVPWNSLLAAVVGGLLLGYGARLAYGCNIGAMLAGISSGSVHGWLWLVSAFAGGIVGVRLRVLFRLDPPAEAAQ